MRCHLANLRGFMTKRENDEIDSIMDYLLEKNKDLYKRLAASGVDDLLGYTKTTIKERRKVATRGKLKSEINSFKGELKCRIR